MYFVDPGGGAFPPGLRLRPRPRRRPHVLLRRLDRPVATYATRATAKLIASTRCPTASSPPATSRKRWKSCSRKKQGQLQRGADRPRLRARAAWSASRCFGVTFEQGRNELEHQRRACLNNIVTENKDAAREREARPAHCPHHPQVHPVQFRLLRRRTGRPSAWARASSRRIHCTRLAGNKADIWQLRQHAQGAGPALPCTTSRRPERDNAIDVYISDEYRGRAGRRRLAETSSPSSPEPLTRGGKEGIPRQRHRRVAWARDAFFPFGDNIERARRSGVQLRGAARRLHPRRSRHRHLQQVRHGHGLHRHAPVPSLIADRCQECQPLQGKRLRALDGCWRRRPRTRHHPGTLKKNPDVRRDLLPCRATAASRRTRECVNIKATDIDGHGRASPQENHIDFAVVAPDDPLALGMVDALAARSASPASAPDKAPPASRAARSFPRT